MKEKKVIIIVENMANWRDQLQHILDNDYHLKIFDDPRDASKKLDDINFDLAILDIRFEDEMQFEFDVTGIRLMQEIRAKKTEAKVIVLTGYPQDVPESIIMNFSPDAFIDKSSFDIDKFKKTVFALLQEA